MKKNTQNIDLRIVTNHQYILHMDLSENEVTSLLTRINNQIRSEPEEKIKDCLKHLLKQLKSKYSIYLSKKIIDKFISINNRNFLAYTNSKFSDIEKEIKNTTPEIRGKRYILSEKREI